jgi:hypothetical protein
MSRHQLDLSSDPNEFGKMATSLDSGAKNEDSPSAQDLDNETKKKFLGLKFTCCGVYSRVYVNRDGTAYEGRCPKCLKSVKLKIGAGGTESRFFEVF